MWVVVVEEASVVALVEMWYADKMNPPTSYRCAEKNAPASRCTTGVYTGVRMGAGNYRELQGKIYKVDQKFVR
jgi:hypothetical protein